MLVPIRGQYFCHMATRYGRYTLTTSQLLAPRWRLRKMTAFLSQTPRWKAMAQYCHMESTGRRHTLTDTYLHFNSRHHNKQKRSLISTFLQRANKISDNKKKTKGDSLRKGCINNEWLHNERNPESYLPQEERSNSNNIPATPIFPKSLESPIN